ncbi:MAG: hypothetical protein IJI59_11475 [Clostridia bacterium]|nr:hypothetical protein [Clostridia bacterium]
MDQALMHEGSGHMAFPRAGRRAGWSGTENKLLWETADEAQQQGLPLKAVFEQIARQTGRRPNSIRNYYYAQVREHDGDAERPARFVPFTQQEVDWLMEQVLVARSAGQSVRSCLQKLAGGDHSLMLRYQNKYRAVIKSRPDYVQDIVEKLKARGVECETPQVNHRVRADLQQSGDVLVSEARRTGDRELAHACDVLAQYLQGRRAPEGDGLSEAARDLIAPIKEFVALDPGARMEAAQAFCDDIARRIGALEERLDECGK